MDLHATVLEVILIAGLGGYIGFLLGLRGGVYLAAQARSRQSKTGASETSVSEAKADAPKMPASSRA